ncbi:MAG: trypsin-like peptidase domain-containing protein [Bryobacteraceae bacterium]|jgi:hypothetical protein
MLAKLLLGCAFLLASDRGLNAQAALDPGTLYKQSSPAVVIIEVTGSDGKLAKAGSGLLVSADGKLLTNYHVIAHSKQATVRLANGDAYDLVEVIAIDKRKDIAFLKIPAVDLPFVKLGRSNAVEIGHTVYSIGSPLGLQNTLSQGLVSGIRDMDGYRLFQISAPISHGSSGGPVFNINGEVIGIAVLTIEGGQNLNFAIPIDYARGMLSMSQTQPLASIYEPELPPDSRVEPQPEAAKIPASAAVIPDDMRKGAFVFLEKKMGVWKFDDARQVLGDPLRQRDALVGTSVDGVIYAFPDPTKGLKEFELNFSGKTGVLRAVYGYPNPVPVMRLKEAQGFWGRDYREVKNANGTRSYMYKNRHLIVVTDAVGNVVNIGVYLP